MLNNHTEEHKKKISNGLIRFYDKFGRKGTLTNGYRELHVGGRRIYEHRYFMEIKIGRKLSRYEHVHHINGIKTDNRIENLVLINESMHSKKHAIENGLGKDRKGISPINKTKVDLIEKILEMRRKGIYLKDISKELKVSITTIIKYCKKKGIKND